jgi:TIR domain
MLQRAPSRPTYLHVGVYMSLNVFISHASVDKPTARRIVETLRDKGISPWIDEDTILVGHSIPGRIADGLDGADLLCVLISKAALESAWVTREFEVFLHKFLKDGRAILPCRLDKSDMPTLISNIKYADFSEDFGTGMKDLLAAVKIGEAAYEHEIIRGYVDKFKAIVERVLSAHPGRSRGDMLQTLIDCMNREEASDEQQNLVDEVALLCNNDDDHDCHGAVRYRSDGTWDLFGDVETAIQELSGLRSASASVSSRLP